MSFPLEYFGEMGMDVLQKQFSFDPIASIIHFFN